MDVGLELSSGSWDLVTEILNKANTLIEHITD